MIRPRPRPTAALRLVCCPYAGVGASAFARWADHLPDAIEFACVQPPGRETRFEEPSLTSTVALGRAVADAVRPLLDRPYALFGHSFGAMVAYEAARSLRDAGDQEPTCLFVSGCRAPFAPWPHPAVRSLDDLALAREVDRRYGGSVPPEVIESEELRALFLSPLRADLAAVETYVHEHGPPLRCRLSAFVGSDDPMVSRAAIDEWRQASTGPFTVRVFPGGHFFVKTAVSAVLAAVIDDLGAAGAAHHSASNSHRPGHG